MENLTPDNQEIDQSSMDTYTPFEPQQAPVIGVGDWVITIFILCIPMANLIVLLLWAFDDKTNPTKANFAKAGLICAAVMLVVILLFGLTALGILRNFLPSDVNFY